MSWETAQWLDVCQTAVKKKRLLTLFLACPSISLAYPQRSAQSSFVSETSLVNDVIQRKTDLQKHVLPRLGTR